MRKKPSSFEISKMNVSDVFFIKRMSDVDADPNARSIWTPGRAMYFTMREDGALLCTMFKEGSATFKPNPSNSNVFKFKTGFRYPGGIYRKVRMVKTPAGPELRSIKPKGFSNAAIKDETVVLTSFEVALIKAKRDKFRSVLYASRRSAKTHKKTHEKDIHEG